jgi:hypothetical protein
MEYSMVDVIQDLIMMVGKKETDEILKKALSDNQDYYNLVNKRLNEELEKIF